MVVLVEPAFVADNPERQLRANSNLFTMPNSVHHLQRTYLALTLPIFIATQSPGSRLFVFYETYG